MITEPPLLTVPAVAAYLSKPPSWVYRNIAALPAVKLGAQYRFRQCDLEAWVAAQVQRGISQ
ncbi:MAG: Helix-turn-helix domain [Mycobacterium sp.]|nr:Helix-turn-helix domain [Mycobacterium sp.]